MNTKDYGIVGRTAPEWDIANWWGPDGKRISPISLSQSAGKTRVVFCFQSWCPGCHSSGFPCLKYLVEGTKGMDHLQFFAIQTVFEGHHANTPEAMREHQAKYDLGIPFAHDAGANSPKTISRFMQQYRTGGTPWFVIIDPQDIVIFNDYHLNPDKALKFLVGLQTQ